MNNLKIVRALLSTNSTFGVSWILIKTIGPLEAMMLSILISKDCTDGEWFLFKTEELQDAINLKRCECDTALKSLKDSGLVETKRMGMPSCTHFKLNYTLILERISNEEPLFEKAEKPQVHIQQPPQPPQKLPEPPQEEPSLFASEEYSFEEFWRDYDKKMNKIDAQKQWAKVPISERRKIKEFIPKYKAAQPNKNFRLYPDKFLIKQAWHNELDDGTTNNANSQYRGTQTCGNGFEQVANISGVGIVRENRRTVNTKN